MHAIRSCTFALIEVDRIDKELNKVRKFMVTLRQKQIYCTGIAMFPDHEMSRSANQYDTKIQSTEVSPVRSLFDGLS